MNEQTTAKKALDAIGKTIFAFTTVISIILIVLGVVLIIKNRPHTPDKTKIYSISLGGTRTIDTVSDEYYNFELNISSGSAAKYTISISNGTLTNITAQNSSMAFSQSSTTTAGYGKSYEAQLSGNSTYTFVVRASSSSLKINVVRR